MKTGIVFSIENKNAIVMKNNGEFINIKAKKDWQKGDVVLIQNEVNRLKVYYSMAACFLVFIIGLSSFNFYYSEVALLSIDINPSIEIKLNRFNRVIALNSLNDEGKQIAETIDITNKKYEEAINLLLTSNEFKSYTDNNSYIYFTVQADNVELENSLLTNLKAINATTFSQVSTLTAEYFLVDKDFVNEAHSHGVSAGKYKVMLELKEAIPSIDISQYSHHSIEDIKTDIENHESISVNDELEENMPLTPTDTHHKSENEEHN